MISAHVTYGQTASQQDLIKPEIPLDSALVQILKLEPQEYTAKRSDMLLENNFGFQIEAFEKVFPAMVSTKIQVVDTKKIGKHRLKKAVATKYINYASLVPVLVAALQEQQLLILQQQQQIDALQKLVTDTVVEIKQ